MPLSRQGKQDVIERYKKGLATAPHAFILGFRGLSVPDATGLRSKVRESGGSYIVVKNRLVRRAIQGAALAELGEHFDGPTAVAYSASDPVALAKALTEFAKEVPVIEFKAGLVEGRRVDGEEIEEIAKLPSRDELLGRLVFLLQSPVTRLARVLGAIPRGFVTVLDQVRIEQVRIEREKGEAG